MLLTLLAGIQIKPAHPTEGLPAVSRDGTRVLLPLEVPGGSCDGGKEVRVLGFDIPAGADAEPSRSWTVGSTCRGQVEFVAQQLAALNQELQRGGYTSVDYARDLSVDLLEGEPLTLAVRRGDRLLAKATSHRPRSRNAMSGMRSVIAVSDKVYFVRLDWIFRGVPHRPDVREWVPVMASRP